MEITEKTYEELVGKYIEYKEKRNHFDALVKQTTDDIDSLLHEEQINNKKVFVSLLDVEYECKYVDRKTKSTDYTRLSEVVSDNVYDEIVSEKTSTFLQIKPTPKSKSKSRNKPIEEKETKPGLMPKAKILK